MLRKHTTDEGLASGWRQCRAGGGARASRVSRWARMAAITRGSVITASTRNAAPQREHWLTSMSNTRRRRCAQASSAHAWGAPSVRHDRSRVRASARAQPGGDGVHCSRSEFSFTFRLVNMSPCAGRPHPKRPTVPATGTRPALSGHECGRADGPNGGRRRAGSLALETLAPGERPTATTPPA